MSKKALKVMADAEARIAEANKVLGVYEAMSLHTFAQLVPFLPEEEKKRISAALEMKGAALRDWISAALEMKGAALRDWSDASGQP